jgi:hypothetical protein
MAVKKVFTNQSGMIKFNMSPTKFNMPPTMPTTTPTPTTATENKIE